MEIPGYQLEHELGKGGMSTVYLALQTSLQRQVALKVMAPVLVTDAVFCERFLQEGRIIAGLRHLNIVTVYDIGAHDKCYYMALEYLQGGNLAERINKGLTVTQALPIIIQVLSALQYAHSQDIIHRDIKPANILFRNANTSVLTDFGVAKAINASAELTQAGFAVGTPRYMSPEQSIGNTVTAKTDLYSVGIILYELLTGQYPYQEGEEKSPFSLLYKKIHDPIPILPQQFGRFQPVLKRLLDKEPEARFENAQEVIKALESLEKPEVVQTRTPGKRSRWIVGLSLTLCVLVAGIIGTDYFWPQVKSRKSDPLFSPASVRDYSVILAIDKRLESLNSLASVYRQILAFDPDNTDAKAGINTAADKYQQLAEESLNNFDEQRAADITAQGLSFVPTHQGLLALRQRLGQAGLNEAELQQLIAKAERYIAMAQFISPPGENAVGIYKTILRLLPEHEVARTRLQQMATLFEQMARKSIANGNSEQGAMQVEQGLLILPTHKGLNELQKMLVMGMDASP